MHIKPFFEKIDACLQNTYMSFHAGEYDCFFVERLNSVHEGRLFAAIEGKLFDRLICSDCVSYFGCRLSEAPGILLSYYNGDILHFGKLDEVQAISNNGVPHFHRGRKPLLNIDNKQYTFILVREIINHAVLQLYINS